ncbi:unnamed protein product [marine sediment metagenome]|uniref:Uncharacterized protein n=1 Tax=marine sediment metagenome TaxID=412755 RepID=X1A508_9ZZZZ
MAEEVVRDFDANMVKAEEIKVFLRRLYYDPEFSTLFNRPVLTMLITATDYLHSNLNVLKVKYLSKP